MLSRHVALIACVLATTFSAGISAAAPAKEEAVTISTIADIPESAGIDSAALREAMQAAINGLDPKDFHRPVSVALAFVSTSNAPTASCVINIAVHDRKKGNIIGTAVGSASASSSAHGDQRANVALIALSNAVSRVPDVVVANSTK